MSTLKTLSTFYYGTTVTIGNNSVDFDEGSGEIRAVLWLGTYSLTAFAAEVQRALREAGSQEYVVTVDRLTRKLTISAPLGFDLLSLTGTHNGTSAYFMMGFDTSIDHTGDDDYEGEYGAGSEYRPQYLLGSYISTADYRGKESATVNKSADGNNIQTIYFGDGARMECDIRLITNKTGIKNTPWFENATGVSDARDFMDFLTTKGRVEFMPDVANRNVFDTLLVESTPEDKNGVFYKLKNMKAVDWYNTGVLQFRKVS